MVQLGELQRDPTILCRRVNRDRHFTTKARSGNAFTVVALDSNRLQGDESGQRRRPGQPISQLCDLCKSAQEPKGEDMRKPKTYGNKIAKRYKMICRNRVGTRQ